MESRRGVRLKGGRGKGRAFPVRRTAKRAGLKRRPRKKRGACPAGSLAAEASVVTGRGGRAALASAATGEAAGGRTPGGGAKQAKAGARLECPPRERGDDQRAERGKRSWRRMVGEREARACPLRAALADRCPVPAPAREALRNGRRVEMQPGQTNWRGPGRARGQRKGRRAGRPTTREGGPAPAR